MSGFCHLPGRRAGVGLRHCNLVLISRDEVMCNADEELGYTVLLG
jgi:hypothetical protein